MLVHNLRKVMKIPSQGFKRGEYICNPLVLFLLVNSFIFVEIFYNGNGLLIWLR